MTEEHNFERWREIRIVHKKFRDFYDVLAGIIIVVVASLIARAFFPDEARSFDANIATTIIGVIITIVVLDRRNERQAEQRYKRQLVDEAASTSNEIAKHAVHIMHRRDWLEGKEGILQGADLSFANLSNVGLMFANLKKASFSNTNMKNVNLFCANLEETNLFNTQFQNASLFNANLYGSEIYRVQFVEADLTLANLSKVKMRMTNFHLAVMCDVIIRDAELIGTFMDGSDLRNADFEGSHLVGVKFYGANLTQANLKNVSIIFPETVFDKNTLLPDGSNWTLNTDMGKFTNPNHPNFWRSNWEGSHAFQDKQI